MSADTAPAAMPGEEDVARVLAEWLEGQGYHLTEDTMVAERYSGGHWHALNLKKVTGPLRALFAPILAEKERDNRQLKLAVAEEEATSRISIACWRGRANEMESRALAAEAALAAERANAVDGSIDIRLDDKGGIDEIFGNGVLCHIERMDKGHWFINMVRPDQSSEAFWLNGKGKVEFTLHEHRKAPTTGPNVEPWTVAAAIRAQGE